LSLVAQRFRLRRPKPTAGGREAPSEHTASTFLPFAILRVTLNNMNAEAIQALLRRQPFEPFELRMSNGEVHQIRHPENAALGRTRLAIMYPDTETDRMVICDLQHINTVEATRPG
jgi:hypothetical protein